MKMVASEEELTDITKVMLQWLPAELAHDMLTEIYNEVVQYSDNESLRDTIKGLILEVHRQQDIDWGGIEELI